MSSMGALGYFRLPGPAWCASFQSNNYQDKRCTDLWQLLGRKYRVLTRASTTGWTRLADATRLSALGALTLRNKKKKKKKKKKTPPHAHAS